MHLEHFGTLLHSSRHKKFNVRQRFAKLGLIRKLLFVLQTGWYQPDTVPFVIDALKVAAQAHFSADDAIKPMVSYLAAHLHEGRLPTFIQGDLFKFMDYRHPTGRLTTLLYITIISSELQTST
jgi:hypothetical protein